MEFPDLFSLTNIDDINQIDSDAMAILFPLYKKDLDYHIDADCLGRLPEPILVKSIALSAIQTIIRLKILEWSSEYYVSPYTTLEEVKEDLLYNTLKNQLAFIGYDFDLIWNAYDLDNFITTNIL